MTTSGSVWALVVLALVSANAPFITERALGVWSLRNAKSLGFRMIELFLAYAFVGGAGLMLEAHAGQIAPQTWEFFAITAVLFLTLAFPGFVYRYLLVRGK